MEFQAANLRKITSILLSVIVAFSFFTIISQSMDPDLGWHIRAGKEILAAGSVPRADSYSHTMPGFPWIAHSWLADAGIAFLWTHDYWPASWVIFSAMSAIPFAVWFIRAHTWFEIWMLFMMAMFMIPILGVRMQILTFFLFFLLFETLGKIEKVSPKTKKLFLAIIPAMFAFWANLHGGFFAGLALLAFFTFGKKIPVPVFLFSILATLLNPYGWGVYKEIYGTFASYESQRYISEWQPGLLGYPSVIYPFPPFIGIYAFLLIKNLKNSDFKTAINIFFLFSFLKSVRMAPLFFASSAYAVGEFIIRVKNEVLEARERNRFPFTKNEIFIFKWGLVLLFAGAIVLFVFNTANYDAGTTPSDKALSALKTAYREERGNIFNEYKFGGYLALRAPEIPVFIDGRMAIWEKPGEISAMHDAVQIRFSGNENAWKEIFARRKISVALVDNSEEENMADTNNAPAPIRWFGKFFGIEKRQKALKRRLLENGWKILYEDKTSAVMIH